MSHFRANSPKVFISYSWESEAHREWVTDLGTRLLSDGVNVMMDDFQLQAGDQLPHFMERAIRESNFVLIICTHGYRRSVEERLGGVGYEGNIITAEMLSGVSERKFIPVLRTKPWNESAPGFCLGKLYVDLSGDPYSDTEYERLLATFYAYSPGSAQPSSLSLQLAPLTLSQQKAYKEFILISLRMFQHASNQLVLKRRNDAGSQKLLRQTQVLIGTEADQAVNLIREISLFGSEPIKRAAGEMIGLVFQAKVASASPRRNQACEVSSFRDEALLKEAKDKFFCEALPKLRQAIQQEVNARSSKA